jgi:surfeit locus 1 family protein
MKIKFNPGIVPTLATLSVVMLTGYLGYWQQGRAESKRGLQLEFEGRIAQPALRISGQRLGDDMQFRRATAHGVWDINNAIFIDNKFDGEQVGYHFFAPLKVSGNQYLLVNLGWVPRGRSYPAVPAIALPKEGADVAGILVSPTTRFLELSGQTVQGAVWQNFTLERYRTATGLDVLPYVLLASQTYVPLKAVTEKPDARVEKHTEYMLTWYSLAITAVILWLAMNSKTYVDREGEPPPDSKGKTA